MADSDDEFYTIPIKDQRVYGSGIKRKRIAFVRASTQSEPATHTHGGDEPTLAEQYISRAQAKKSTEVDDAGNSTPPSLPVCELCKQPIRDSTSTSGVPHEATITHQIALKHSYGPAAIDRKSRGLPYMEAQGWDPDARQGLGASGEGMLYPIEAKERRARLGLGLKPKTKASLHPKRSVGAGVQKHQNLNAKQMRKLDAEERQQTEKLREMFYRDGKAETLLNTLNGTSSRPKNHQRKDNRANGRGSEAILTKGRWV